MRNSTLLLALLKQKDNKCRQLLEKEGINYTSMYDNVVSLFGKKANKPFYMEYTTTYKKVLENAITLSRKKQEDKVSKMAQSLADEFSDLCGNVNFSHNYHGSSDAYKKTQGADKDSTSYLDMAFASRDFKLDSSEQAVEGTYGTLCIDAIVPVVNLENTCSQITKDQLVKMYTGVYTKWNEIK